MNVHRWRQLESSDPVLYETIFRVQSLQRRLIQISEEIQQRERLTAEKEKLFKDLKLILDRQPGVAVRAVLLQPRTEFVHFVVPGFTWRKLIEPLEASAVLLLMSIMLTCCQ